MTPEVVETKLAISLQRLREASAKLSRPHAAGANGTEKVEMVEPEAPELSFWDRLRALLGAGR